MIFRNGFRSVTKVSALSQGAGRDYHKIFRNNLGRGALDSFWKRWNSVDNETSRTENKSKTGIFTSIFDYVKSDLKKSTLFKDETAKDTDIDFDMDNDDSIFNPKSTLNKDNTKNINNIEMEGENINKVDDIYKESNTTEHNKEQFDKTNITEDKDTNIHLKEDNNIHIKEDTSRQSETKQKININDEKIGKDDATDKTGWFNDVFNSIKNSAKSGSNSSDSSNDFNFKARIFSEDNLNSEPVERQAPKSQSTQTSVDIFRGIGSYWERFYSVLRSSPIIDKFIKAKQEFNETEIGEQITDITENIRQKWETSQHPIVYRLSYYYHKLFSISERDQCIKIARVTDPSFNIPEFKVELEENTFPSIVKAFLGSDKETLQKVCSQDCYENLETFIRLRQADGLSAKYQVYRVTNVNFLKSFRLNGSPVFIYSAIVTQDNCIYDKNHNVVFGGESEVSEMVYIVAVQQILQEESHKMTWKIIELSFQELNF